MSLVAVPSSPDPAPNGRGVRRAGQPTRAANGCVCPVSVEPTAVHPARGGHETAARGADAARRPVSFSDHDVPFQSHSRGARPRMAAHEPGEEQETATGARLGPSSGTDGPEDAGSLAQAW